jgi:hypothetical protein
LVRVVLILPPRNNVKKVCVSYCKKNCFEILYFWQDSHRWMMTHVFIVFRRRWHPAARYYTTRWLRFLNITYRHIWSRPNSHFLGIPLLMMFWKASTVIACFDWAAKARAMYDDEECHANEWPRCFRIASCVAEVGGKSCSCV